MNKIKSNNIIEIVLVIFIYFSVSTKCFSAIENAYFTVTTTIKTEELKKKSISTKLADNPSLIEINTNSALIGELIRGGFRYVDKGGDIIIYVSASHGSQVAGTATRPFRWKQDLESEDISFFSLTASMSGKPIWEGTIRIPTEELGGKYTHLCIRTLLQRFDKDSAGEDDCD